MLGAAPGKEQVAGYCSSNWNTQQPCGERALQLAMLDLCVYHCKKERAKEGKGRVVVCLLLLGVPGPDPSSSCRADFQDS